MDSGKVSAVDLARQLMDAYPLNHPDISPANFNCCGGNDETPQEHTLDCPYLARVCLYGLLAERDGLKQDLRMVRESQERQRQLNDALTLERDGLKGKLEKMKDFITLNITCDYERKTSGSLPLGQLIHAKSCRRCEALKEIDKCQQNKS